MNWADRADKFQRRHPVVGLPIGVIYKFFDDQGAYLAALITYYGFLSIFPLILLLQSILGYVIHGNQNLHTEIMNSVLGQIPVLGNQLHSSTEVIRGSASAVITGSLVALYGGLGVAQALQNASNACWGVPRNHRPNPILARLRSAAVLLFLGAALIAVGWLPHLWSPLRGYPGTILNVVIGTGIFLLLMKMTTARGQGWGQLAPGAFLISLVWQAFIAGAGLFNEVFGARSKDTYGTYGSVLTLLLASYLLALAFVFGTELNVVLIKHLYPRALLTPFIDDVDLTLADHEAYTLLAQMQQLKGYQHIDVVFDKDEDGYADAPSDLEYRWHHAKIANQQRLERPHPQRPSDMWGLQHDDEDGSR